MPVLYQGKMIAGNNTGGVSDIQTKLEGSPGQVVGFDASGNATAIQGWSNPNLLVNWDFRNPINSQGKTAYSGNGYSIDNWYILGTLNTHIAAGYIKVENTSTSDGYLLQTIDKSRIVMNAGQTITNSALIRAEKPTSSAGDVVLYCGYNSNSGEDSFVNLGNILVPVTSDYDVKSFSYVSPSISESNIYGDFQMFCVKLEPGAVVYIKAVKAEYGSYQTLAHKMGDTWILNDAVPCLPIEMLRMGYRWCNPNLLDNWYFANPVNQRGQTEYTGGGYTIDRWSSYSETPTVNVTDSGITIGYGDWGQPLELSRFQLGTYTISALTSTGVLASSTFNISSLTAKTDIITPFGGGTNLYLRFIIPWIKCGLMFITNASETESVPIVAAKLELGPIQTLAHQENGVWVLNEIPDYGEELRKCQRYCYNIYKINSTIGQFQQYKENECAIFISLPAELSKTPSVSYTGLFRFCYYDRVANAFKTAMLDFNNITNVYPRANGTTLVVGFNDSAFNIPIGTAGWVDITSDGCQYLISADL